MSRTASACRTSPRKPLRQHETWLGVRCTPIPRCARSPCRFSTPVWRCRFGFISAERLWLMEFFCYHRDRPGSTALRHELLEEHWSYMDGYAAEMIARGP